jgi:hypothetical protein
MRRNITLALLLTVSAVSMTAIASAQWKPTVSEDDRMKGSYRFEPWVILAVIRSSPQIF